MDLPLENHLRVATAMICSRRAMTTSPKAIFTLRKDDDMTTGRRQIYCGLVEARSGTPGARLPRRTYTAPVPNVLFLFLCSTYRYNNKIVCRNTCHRLPEPCPARCHGQQSVVDATGGASSWRAGVIVSGAAGVCAVELDHRPWRRTLWQLLHRVRHRHDVVVNSGRHRRGRR